MKRIFSLFIVFMLTCSLTVVAFAENKNKDMIIQEDEVVNSDLFAAGNVVKNKGTINGDIFAASAAFENTGHVLGDIIVATKNSKLGGSVDGDLRIATADLIITGEISKNVTAFSQQFLLTQNAAIDGSIHVLSQSVEINGIVGGDFRGRANNILINGEIKGDVVVETENLSFGSNAKIDGNLVYKSSKKIDMPKGIVSGDIEHKLIESKNDMNKNKVKRGAKTFNIVGKCIGFISYLIISILLMLLFKNFIKKTSITINQKPWHSLGIGIVGLIVIPIASILIMITVVGIPLGIISIVLYGILLYLSKIPAALWIGEKIFKNDEKPLVSMVLGMSILLLIGFIPYLGRFVTIVAVAFGVGSYLINIKETIRNTKDRETLS